MEFILYSLGVIALIAIWSVISSLRLAGNVYKTFDSFYLRRGHIRNGWYDWQPVNEIIPGILYIINGKQGFRLDDYGFVPVRKK